MDTRKEAAPPPPPPPPQVVVGEEKAEEVLDDEQAASQLCRQHCDGVPASYGIDGRKSTVVCTTADFDDGSGEASTAGKCRNMNQQADHYKCQ